MEVKWFFVLFGILFTSAILLGQLFIGTYLSEQDRKHFEATQEGQTERYGNTSLMHKFIYDNVTGLRTDWNTGLQPLLNQIENATQERIDQETHYNQTSEDFKKIEQVLELKLEDHETLGQVLDIKIEDHETLGVLNQSLATIAEVLNGTSGTNGSLIYIPIPVDNKHNQSDKCDSYMINKTTYHPYCKVTE